MSLLEDTLDGYRRSNPQLTVRDKITGTGRRIITGKGPDGVVYKYHIHENRDSAARVRLQQRYRQRKHFQLHVIDPTCFIKSLLHHGTPAVLVSDDCGSVIVTNKPEQINATQQHKLVKIEPGRYLVESVSEEEFNELEKQMQQLEIS